MGGPGTGPGKRGAEEICDGQVPAGHGTGGARQPMAHGSQKIEQRYPEQREQPPAQREPPVEQSSEKGGQGWPPDTPIVEQGVHTESEGKTRLQVREEQAKAGKSPGDGEGERNKSMEVRNGHSGSARVILTSRWERLPCHSSESFCQAGYTSRL